MAKCLGNGYVSVTATDSRGGATKLAASTETGRMEADAAVALEAYVASRVRLCALAMRQRTAATAATSIRGEKTTTPASDRPSSVAPTSVPTTLLNHHLKTDPTPSSPPSLLGGMALAAVVSALCLFGIFGCLCLCLCCRRRRRRLADAEAGQMADIELD